MDAQTATATHYCKFPSCQNEASSPVGRYSYCKEHQNRDAAKPAQPAVNGGGTVKQLQETMALAKRVDRARAKAETATRGALRLKQAADGLEREYRERLREIVAEAA